MVCFFYGCFLRFLNCTNGTKTRKASHIIRTFVYNGLWRVVAIAFSGVTKKTPNPGGNYMFRVLTTETLEQGVKYVQS